MYVYGVFPNSVCIYGGGDRNGQITAVKRGVDIVIGTVLFMSIIACMHKI